MKRLTEREFDFCGNACKHWDDCQSDENGFIKCKARRIYEKLAVFENLEEDGKLKVVSNS